MFGTTVHILYFLYLQHPLVSTDLLQTVHIPNDLPSQES